MEIKLILLNFIRFRLAEYNDRHDDDGKTTEWQGHGQKQALEPVGCTICRE